MEKSSVFQMRTGPDFIEKLDEWRRQQRDIPSRAETVRRLVERGLKADQETAA